SEGSHGGFVATLVALAADLECHGEMRIVDNAAGVAEPEVVPGPVGAREVPIARRTRLVGHDRGVAADDPVEQRRLTHVRSSDQGDDRSIHAAHRAATIAASRLRNCSGSPSTSMKSYDGCTGKSKVARTSSKRSSSRNMPASLMVSAGI